MMGAFSLRVSDSALRQVLSLSLSLSLQYVTDVAINLRGNVDSERTSIHKYRIL